MQRVLQILGSSLLILVSSCLTTSKRKIPVASEGIKGNENSSQLFSDPSIVTKFDLASGLNSSEERVQKNFNKFGAALKAMGLDNTKPINLPAELFKEALDRYKITNFKPQSVTGIATMTLLNEWASAGTTFNAMLDTILYAGSHRQQPFVNFMHLALEKGWLNEIHDIYIAKACVSTMVLEVLTIAANNSNVFGQELLSHYYNELKLRGIDSSKLYQTLWKLKAKIGLFPAVKFLSITPGVVASVAKGLNGGREFENKKDLNRILKKHNIHPLNSMEIANSLARDDSLGNENIGFRMNVAEATIVDSNRDLYNNSLTGSKIMIWTETHRTKSDWVSSPVLPASYSSELWDSVYSRLNLDSLSKDSARNSYYDRTFFSKELIASYVSWNAAFVLTEFGPENLENFVWLWIKLIIPSTFGVRPEDYLSTRKWSLWLAGTAFLMNWLDQIEINDPAKFPATPETLSKKFYEISEEWGKINHSYADSVLDECDSYSDGEALKWYWKWIEDIGTTKLIFDYVVLRNYPQIIPDKRTAAILDQNKECLAGSPTMNM